MGLQAFASTARAARPGGEPWTGSSWTGGLWVERPWHGTPWAGTPRVVMFLGRLFLDRAFPVGTYLVKTLLAVSLLAVAFPAWTLPALAAPPSGSCPGDAPPVDADQWSVQTAPSPQMRALAAKLRRQDVGESVRAVMVHIVENLAYDSGLNVEQFDRTAEDIFRERTLGGCSEFALAVLALLRAMDIPSRLVLTANSEWMEAYRRNPYAIPNGHSLVEVWDGKEWLLADPTSLTLYERYDPCSPCLPGGEIFMARGADFWALGVTTVEQASGMLRATALAPPPSCAKPTCLARFTATVDFVRAFLNQGTIFYERGKYNLAARLARKAHELSPGDARALLLHGKALLAEGQCDRGRDLLMQAARPDAAVKDSGQDQASRREARALLRKGDICPAKTAP